MTDFYFFIVCYTNSFLQIFLLLLLFNIHLFTYLFYYYYFPFLIITYYSVIVFLIAFFIIIIIIIIIYTHLCRTFVSDTYYYLQSDFHFSL